MQSYNKGIVRGGKKFGPKYHLEIFISTHASDETKSENETIEAKCAFSYRLEFLLFSPSNREDTYIDYWPLYDGLITGRWEH